MSLTLLIGARGFEPPTSCAQGRRASQAAPRPEWDSLCHTRGMIVVAVFAVYGMLVEVEAFLTFKQTGSKDTLLAGLLSGMLMMVAVVLLVLRVPIGASIGLGVILAMMGVFGFRYLRTRMFFPSGIMFAVSLLAVSMLFGMMKT